MYKLYIIFAILSFNINFAQRIDIDSSRVKYLNTDIITKKLMKSYDEVIKISDEKEFLPVGCGNTYEEFERSIINKKLLVFLEKYPFLISDLKELNLKDDELQNISWILNHSKEKMKKFTLRGKNLQAYKKWKLENQTSILVIVDKTNENTEYVQLKIIFPGEKREIIKEYKLYEFGVKWQSETFDPKLTS